MTSGAPPSPPPRRWPTRRTYAACAAAFALFAIYGSLVPLRFHRIGFDEALRTFAAIRQFDLLAGSRTDLATNVLLFVPIGFFCLGALRVDRRGVAGAVAAMAAVALVSGGLSLAIEFAQIFTALRTPSMRDVAAQGIGAAGGMVLWVALGAGLTEWLRELSGERDRLTLVTGLLTGYAALLFASQLMPFDLTLSPGELAQKYREGRVSLRLFTYQYPSTFEFAWDVGVDILLYVPVGALALLRWTRTDGWRRALGAWLLGLGFVGGVEGAQLFVFSRYSDVTDLVVGSAGVAIGVLAATRMPNSSRGAGREGSRSRVRGWAIAAALAWVAVLCAYHWQPFDFAFERQLAKERLPALFAVPFTAYYAGSPFNASTQFLRKLVLSVPLGMLFRTAWASSTSRPVAKLQLVLLGAAGVAILFAIEAGQVFLRDRFPDPADVLIGALGVSIGMRGVTLLRRRAEEAL